MWTNLRDTRREVAPRQTQYAVDAVELTRLQLNLRGVAGVSSVSDVLLRNGQQLVVRGGSATHVPTDQALPLHGREPLFCNGQEVVLRGSSVLHVATARAVERTDALFRSGDAVRLVGDLVEHAATGTRVARLDGGSAAPEVEGVAPEELLLEQLRADEEEVGGVISIAERGVVFKNVAAVFVGKETPIVLEGIDEAVDAEITHVDTGGDARLRKLVPMLLVGLRRKH